MRGLLKGVRNATRKVTRSVKKLFRGGARTKRTPLKRVTNAVRGVGKKFRNTVSSVFALNKKKTRRNRKAVRKGHDHTKPPGPVVYTPHHSGHLAPTGSHGAPPAPVQYGIVHHSQAAGRRRRR